MVELGSCNGMRWEWDEDGRLHSYAGTGTSRVGTLSTDGYGSQEWRRRRRLDSAPSFQLSEYIREQRRSCQNGLGHY